MKKLLLILFFLNLLSVCSFSQVVSQQWARRYVNAYSDFGKFVVTDNTGNVYIVGGKGIANNTVDILIIKYNSVGVEQWAVTYAGPGGSQDVANWMWVDGSGNVYVTGSSIGGGNTENDIITLKYNSSGVLLWAARYNGAGADTQEFGQSMGVDASGNVIVLGRGGPTYDIILIKYNSSGQQQWLSTYSGNSSNVQDYANQLEIDASGNYYIIGSVADTSFDFRMTTIKFSNSGSFLWAKRFYGFGYSGTEGFDLAVDYNNNNVYVTGTNSQVGAKDIITVGYNSGGTELWSKKYDNMNGDDVPSYIVTDGIRVYVTGYSIGFNSGVYSNDYVTLGYSTSGGELWTSRYNGPGNGFDNAYFITIDNVGSVYVTGASTGLSPNGLDYATVKYSASGNQLWVERYNNANDNGNDYAYGIYVDNSYNVYVTGASYSAANNYDCYTIKYAPLVGIQSQGNEIPNQFSLSQNYPNPFNPTTDIHFAIPKSSFVKLVIFDLLGRELEIIVNENLSAGTYNVDWDASKYSSGVYVYKLETENFSEIKKMVLVK